MALSKSSMIRLAHGDMEKLPVQLQILDINRLDGDISGVCIARLKLSDGENYYAGFAIGTSILDSLRINLHAVVRVNEIIPLKHSSGRLVLQIIDLELISQEHAPIGEPEPCQLQLVPVLTPTLASSSSYNMDASSTSEQHFPSIESLSILEQTQPETNSMSIVTLTPLSGRQAAVEGRVVRKSEIFTYGNDNGKFFTFDLADLSGEIRCKAFNGVVDTFFDTVDFGNVYHISNFIINRANKQYNHLLHDFEISMTKDTLVYQINDNVYKNVDVSFNITKVSQITLEDIGKSFDLLVTIKSVGDLDSSYVSKKNRFYSKRIVSVIDCNDTVNMVFWGELAKTFDGKVNQLMRVKDLIAQSFKGQLQFVSTMATIVRYQE